MIKIIYSFLTPGCIADEQRLGVSQPRPITVWATVNILLTDVRLGRKQEVVSLHQRNCRRGTVVKEAETWVLLATAWEWLTTTYTRVKTEMFTRTKDMSSAVKQTEHFYPKSLYGLLNVFFWHFPSIFEAETLHKKAYLSRQCENANLAQIMPLQLFWPGAQNAKCQLYDRFMVDGQMSFWSRFLDPFKVLCWEEMLDFGADDGGMQTPVAQQTLLFQLQNFDDNPMICKNLSGFWRSKSV